MVVTTLIASRARMVQIKDGGHRGREADAMTSPDQTTGSPRPEIAEVTFHEIWSSLKAGMWDFRAAPQYGLFFSAFYAVGGCLLALLGAGTFIWTLALALGFPLVAPFAAVGLYEVSRRLEAEERLDWTGVLGVVWRERGRHCLLYTSPSPRDGLLSRMPSSA